MHSAALAAVTERVASDARAAASCLASSAVALQALQLEHARLQMVAAVCIGEDTGVIASLTCGACLAAAAACDDAYHSSKCGSRWPATGPPHTITSADEATSGEGAALLAGPPAASRVCERHLRQRTNSTHVARFADLYGGGGGASACGPAVDWGADGAGSKRRRSGALGGGGAASPDRFDRDCLLPSDAFTAAWPYARGNRLGCARYIDEVGRPVLAALHEPFTTVRLRPLVGRRMASDAARFPLCVSLSQSAPSRLLQGQRRSNDEACVAEGGWPAGGAAVMYDQESASTVALPLAEPACRDFAVPDSQSALALSVTAASLLHEHDDGAKVAALRSALGKTSGPYALPLLPGVAASSCGTCAQPRLSSCEGNLVSPAQTPAAVGTRSWRWLPVADVDAMASAAAAASALAALEAWAGRGRALAAAAMSIVGEK